MGCDWWDVACIVEETLLSMVKAVVDGIVGIFTFIIEAIAWAIVFLIRSLEAGLRFIFDSILAMMEMLLGQFGIATPIIMAVATALFIIVVGATILFLFWLGERLYELL